MDIKNNRIGKYLDGKVQEYFNIEYKQLTVKQCSEFISKLKEGHTKEELESMTIILEGEIEQSKLYGPTQTFCNSLITILVGTFIALFTCFSGFSLNTAMLFLKRDEISDINQKADSLAFTFNTVLNKGGIVFLILIVVLAFVGIAVQNYRNNFGRFHFYNQIIDKCIEKKETEEKEKEEQERANTNKLASSRKGSSRYR
ncbi:hypothetical protein [Bacillus cereus group sp. BfR-BA-01489]|uniref:hypothetical protein n=1 Tax=Bacillus cereus group sp. BfR-BA-01489 TaxID=2920358 RepID=UPI001F5AA599